VRFFRLLSLGVALWLPMLVAAQQITVSAAASLTDAFKEIGTQFEAAKPGVTVRFNFAASGVLLQQMKQGAPVDVLATADQETMLRAVELKLVASDTRKDFASNTLVMIEPLKEGLGLKSLQDLSNPKVKKIAIGKTLTVPVGRYTQQVLEDAKLWTTLESKYVQADNVRQVLDYVARGEVDAGFVYKTDAARMGNKVRIVLTPTGHSPVTYPVAVVADSKQKNAAKEFVAFLFTDAAQQVLARYGFGKP
jgi:molybdate transport system substrate-binding protein